MPSLLVFFFNSHSLTSLLDQTAKNLQCRRPGFDPLVGRVPCRRKWQTTPVFFLGEPHGQEEPGGLESMGLQRIEHD